jgi:hypothetical protein
MKLRITGIQFLIGLALIDLIHATTLVKMIWRTADIGYLPHSILIPSAVIRGILIVSMLPLAAGFLLKKRWAFKLYYIQFAFRIYVNICTLSFITVFTGPHIKRFEPFYLHPAYEYLPILLGNAVIIVGFEIFRLVFSIKMGKRLFPATAK